MFGTDKGLDLIENRQKVNPLHKINSNKNTTAVSVSKSGRFCVVAYSDNSVYL